MENEPDLPEIHVRSLLMLRHLLSLFSCLLCLTVFAACGDDRRGDDDDTTIEDTNPEDLDGDGFCPGDDCEDNDLNPGDCDDADGDAYPGNVESCDASDNNCDGRIDEDFDRDQDGYMDEFGTGCISHYPEDELDCNDLIASINPGAEEQCDGNDNNCNGIIDDGLDVDGDGYRTCDIPGDCDDNDSSVYPNAPEVCDGVDNNCNGLDDDGIGVEFTDADGDGWTPCMGDCDDTLPVGPDINPGETEACDELDNDCDGDVDEDLDMDGDGIPGAAPGCLAMYGAIDCDDNDPTLYPGAPEFCDLLDNDCDGAIDEGLDFDNDGYTSCEGDCDSLNPAMNPGVNETCDGLDNDCNGIIDDGFDLDGDGQSVCAGDCDDSNPAVFAGSPELCDGIDNDCDNLIGPNESDIDGDGFSECDGDCDETDTTRFPGATELCNVIDDDCDGVVPSDELDDDLDGFIGCTPSGCAISLVEDGNDGLTSAEAVFGPLGLEFNSVSDAVANGTLEDLSGFSGSQVLVWQTGARDIAIAEYDALSAWIDAGNTLVVTGANSLSNSQCYYDQSTMGDDDDSAAGDDDDSAAGDDDDSSLGDDDDSSLGDDDDSAVAEDCSSEIAVTGTLMAALVRSVTAGEGPTSTSCAVSNTSTPMTSGPFGTFSPAFTFSASSSVHENATANSGLGAVRVAAIGSKAKVLHTELASGGRVIFWNGDGVSDWAADPGAASLILNGVTAGNAGCGGILQGGDCDDNDATLFPGTCN